MTKIQLKSDNINPFGGLFSILKIQLGEKSRQQIGVTKMFCFCGI